MEQNHIQELIEEARAKAFKMFGDLKEPDRTHAICSFFDETDTGNAARLVLRFQSKMKWVGKHERGEWRAFDGKKWADDSKAEKMISNFAQKTASQIRFEIKLLKARFEDQAKADAAAGRRFKHHLKSCDSNKISSMKKESSLAVFADLEEFDKPKKTAQLYNVKNGTIDLRTGKMKSHDPADMITKIVDLDYDPNAKCPDFDKFLFSICEDNPEMVEFIMTLFGYAAHGHQDEEIAIFFLGNQKQRRKNGSNGKTKLFEALRPVFGEYAWTVNPNLITTSKNKNDESNDVARLEGYRIAFGSEFKKDDVIDDDIFKRLTGGDTINARAKFGRSVQFQSTATLFFTAQNPPEMNASDHSIERRPIYIPLNRAFYKKSDHPDGIPQGGFEANPHLSRKFQEQMEGILACLVRGAIRYNNNGITIPSEILDFKAQKLASYDPLDQWIKQCVVFDGARKCLQRDLHDSYKNFCLFNGVGTFSISSKEFGKLLENMGIEGKIIGGKNKRLGVGLTPVGQSFANDHIPADTDVEASDRRVLPFK